MAAKWLKYGLCIFGGLGIGYVVGVKITKNKAEEEIDQKIRDIREIYRNERKASKPVKKKEEVVDKPDLQAKTSIDIQRLSEKKERAEEAMNKYSKAFKPEPKENQESEDKDEKSDDDDWLDHIHIVDEFPEDCEYRGEVLNYYSDGVVTRSPSDQRLTDEECFHLIGGNETLRRLDEEDCNQVLVLNDIYEIKYTVIYRYQEWAKVVEEEPYKATL